ncbi:disulfide oxidoreductase [Bacillus sp. AFS002410]|uniref:AAA domain-containing protein n=1 Tax=Bacillus sp. AFS002410 TaxID=2033481 RepID=UPI000BF0D285|nr:AAA domain-containing protein [Bacillus sp. AFS002410]PEJ57290.1 disulfide oxidoreductase [Bacillus sp. AFS002410]
MLNKLSDVNNLITEWQSAIEAERNYLKFHGGRSYTLTKGTPLYQIGQSTVILFTIYAEIFVPEGTPVRIKIENQEYQGEMLSFKGSQVEIKINESFQTTIPYAELFNEPWELLDQLIDRLEEIKDYRGKQKKVLKLMNADSTAKHLTKMKKDTLVLQELIYRSFYNATTYIWGPPGTGKSYNLTKIILKHYEKNKSVLVIAHSNAAVDVLMKNVIHELEQKEKWKSGEIVRYGYTKDEVLLQHEDILSSKLVEVSGEINHDELENLDERKHSMLKKARRGAASKQELNDLSKIQNKLNKIRSEIREKEKELIDQAKVIGTTLSKCSIDPLIYLRQFDLVIVDEISMAYTPQIAFAATLGKRIVVCGDFKQLPPIASCFHNDYVKKWLQEDLFHHTGIVQRVENGEPLPNLVLLNKQRRMHPAISGFTNKEIYQSLVFDHPSVKRRQEIAKHRPFPMKANSLINSQFLKTYALKDSNTKSRYNLGSAIIAIQCILTSIVDGVNSIGIVTPYRAQAKLLSALHKEIIGKTKYRELPIQIATVHRFQGAECDVIIFDSVDTYPQYSPGLLLTDQNSERLINVALTRARGKFIHIADIPFVKNKTKPNKAINKLIQYQVNHDHKVAKEEFNKLFTKSISKRLKLFFNDSTKGITELVNDLKNANKNIVVSMSNLSTMSLEIRKIINEIEIPILFISEAHFEKQKNRRFIKKDQVQPFIMIDNEVLWYGIPMSNVSLNQSNNSVRLQSPLTIQVLKGFIDF